MKAIVTACLSVLLVSTASAASIEYRMLINGEDPGDGDYSVAAGVHTLTVEGRVTENDIVPDTPGGFIQASFDLMKDSDAVLFVEGEGFLGAPNGLWDSTPNDAFQQHNAGALDAAGNVIQETGSILQSQWNTRFADVGAGVWSLISSGPFEFTGTGAANISLVSSAGVNLVASLDGANVGGRIPNSPEDSVVGDSVRVIPEPSTILLTSLAMLGLVLRRRN